MLRNRVDSLSRDLDEARAAAAVQAARLTARQLNLHLIVTGVALQALSSSLSSKGAGAGSIADAAGSCLALLGSVATLAGLVLTAIPGEELMAGLRALLGLPAPGSVPSKGGQGSGPRHATPPAAAPGTTLLPSALGKLGKQGAAAMRTSAAAATPRASLDAQSHAGGGAASR